MQKNPIAVEAIGFFCSIGKLVLVEGFRQVGQIVFSWQRGECLSHGRDEPLGGVDLYSSLICESTCLRAGFGGDS